AGCSWHLLMDLIMRLGDVYETRGDSLRHTFASHFIQNGGNILTLQKILGHSSLAMTMRYAHLAPDHLADAVRLAPKVGS
ncbi:tyrosine-type recombinase/integrase, partial [Pseudomonas sp. BMS12]|uniref:tyrosine-type recombinase/integrase n=1 Tax=Pseudomonas sp. BMS12 TaxID=1796033 RepID=UPI001F02C612